MNILQSALGNYEAFASIPDADVVIGHSFGTITEKGSVNDLLGDFILEHAGALPLVADQKLAEVFKDRPKKVDCVVEGPLSDSVGQGVGSWGTLVAAKSFMEQENLHTALMVAQACHVGRVAMQARRLNITSAVPRGLPNTFDGASEQIWTRSKSLWIPRELLGSVVLRLQNKL